jgi:hypothetical protein
VAAHIPGPNNRCCSYTGYGCAPGVFSKATSSGWAPLFDPSTGIWENGGTGKPKAALYWQWLINNLTQPNLRPDAPPKPCDLFLTKPACLNVRLHNHDSHRICKPCATITTQSNRGRADIVGNVAARPEDWEGLGTLRVGHQPLCSTTATTHATPSALATHHCLHTALHLVQGRHGHRRHKYTGFVSSRFALRMLRTVHGSQRLQRMVFPRRAMLFKDGHFFVHPESSRGRVCADPQHDVSDNDSHASGRGSSANRRENCLAVYGDGCGG